MKSRVNLTSCPDGDLLTVQNMTSCVLGRVEDVVQVTFLPGISLYKQT